jgi:hypothetical protein
MSATQLIWIMRHEVASNAPTDFGTTDLELGVDGAGLFHVHRPEPHQGPVVTTHATLTDALVELPHAPALEADVPSVRATSAGAAAVLGRMAVIVDRKRGACSQHGGVVTVWLGLTGRR